MSTLFHITNDDGHKLEIGQTYSVGIHQTVACISSRLMHLSLTTTELERVITELQYMLKHLKECNRDD